MLLLDLNDTAYNRTAATMWEIYHRTHQIGRIKAVVSQWVYSNKIAPNILQIKTILELYWYFRRGEEFTGTYSSIEHYEKWISIVPKGWTRKNPIYKKRVRKAFRKFRDKLVRTGKALRSIRPAHHKPEKRVNLRATRRL